MEKGFEREVLDRLTVIETKLDDYNKTKTTSEEANERSKSNEKDIYEIKDKIKWLSRTVAGALITGLIGILLVIFKIGIGIK